MKNPFKGNTLACGLLGFILGIGITFGAQQICSHKTWEESHHEGGGDGRAFVNINGKDVDVADINKEDEGCSSLSLAKETKRTTREKAQAGGLKPCSKCAPGY